MRTSHRLSIVVGTLTLLLFSWWVTHSSVGRCSDRRIYLDGANGLRAGAGVYAAGGRVGRIESVEPHGRRTAVDLCLHSDATVSLNPHTTFFLDRDPENPQVFCLRALSHHIPEDDARK